MLGLLVLSAGSVQAQYSNYALPKIIKYQPGSYQLADGSWHGGQLYPDQGEHLRVRNPDDKKITEYQPLEVKAFVVEGDTFSVIRNIDISARRRVASAFAKQLYRCGNFTLLDFEHGAAGAATVMLGGQTPQNDLVLQPRLGDAVRVPASRGAFEKTMLPLFGDCPELAQKIKAGKVGRQHMKSILQTYARWQQTAPAGGN
ncbi:hypothetical protein [Hymenobacter persicinus]|uniref:Uncharacterized protein n=1 Tax=Hymenobacter persicinus TaxID=2025506 RepID=A0A4Q5LFE2_9BACT|nr:hypothetical protein [Hymenobacter persicinus]RYU81562.1 hypothetical protein EWM57_06075 [Hymenobacter persicinus]